MDPLRQRYQQQMDEKADLQGGCCTSDSIPFLGHMAGKQVKRAGQRERSCSLLCSVATINPLLNEAQGLMGKPLGRQTLLQG